MVDADRVAAMLQRLRGEVAYLSARAEDDRDAVRADDERMSGLKYRFVTALETVVNIAQHLCASEGWGPPSSNAASLIVLGKQRVLPVDLAQRLSQAVGFRNILVHQYDEVDDDKVIAHLDEIEDLHAYVAAVATWVAAQEEAGGAP